MPISATCSVADHIVGVLAQPAQQQAGRVIGPSGPQQRAGQARDQQAGRGGVVGLRVRCDRVGRTVGRQIDVALQRPDAGEIAILRLQPVGRCQRRIDARWTSGRS